MISYVVRRLVIAIPTLFLICTAAFFLMREAPGTPLTGDRSLPVEIERNILAYYHLDKPRLVQFGIWLGVWPVEAADPARWNPESPSYDPDCARLSQFDPVADLPDKCTHEVFRGLFQGDLGPSFKIKDQTVADLIAQGAPVSITLGITAMSIALVVGMFLGTMAALRQNTAADYAVMATATFGITIPNYVVGPVLALVFAVWLGVLPAGGWVTTQGVEAMALPVITLALPQIAIMSRLTRSGMIEVLRSNFVRTARAKGLPERVVLWRHALKAGILPLVAYLGPGTAALMTGSLVVEQIFGLPGIGRFFVEGALDRDYSVVMGVVIVYATLIIGLNLISDILVALMDPRVRYE
ncbi:MAG: ABC transporter permease [Alphaproteobacteria bacterium]